MDRNHVNNLGRVSPKERHCQIISKACVQEDLLKFHYKTYKENKPCPNSGSEKSGQLDLGRGSTKKDLCQIIFKLGQYFLTRRFNKFSLNTYKENKLHPLAAMFFNGSE